MRLLESILVPVDFSDTTRDVLECAAAVARAFRSEIILQCVLPQAGEPGDELEKLLAMARAGAGARLGELRQAVESQGAKVSDAVVGQGTLADEIVSLADERGVNVIMLGAAGSGGASPHGLGTTADSVRRLSSKPVWLVKPGHPPPPRAILCPVDFSPASERALRNAIHLARRLGARLTVMTVVPTAAGWTTALFSAGEAAEREQVALQTKRFGGFVERLDFHEVSWDKEVRRGDPAEQILQAAAAGPADLLVMGSAGLTGLWRMFAGSVTEKVAARVPCSILTMIGEDAIRLKVDEELTDIETHYARGRQLLDNGFPEEARRQFEHCVSINDLFVPGWEALAEAYGRLGQKAREQESRATAEKVREALSWSMIQAEIRAKHPVWGKGPGGA